MPTLLPKRPVLTGDAPSDVGFLTHALIGSHLQHFLAGEPADNLLARMYAVAYAVINANPNKTRVLATEAASHAYRYFTDYVPNSEWRLLGVEYPTGDGGFADVAWRHRDTGKVFYDEIKTSRPASGHKIAAKWLTQCHRYTKSGVRQWGARFAGVRLIPLSTRGHVRLVGTYSNVPLAPSPDNPLHEVEAR